jgi:uridine kinase
MRRSDPAAPRFHFCHANADVFDANHPESVDFSALLARVTASSCKLVIAEGHLLLTHQSLVNKARLTIYLDVPDDVRSMRRMKRDLEEGRLGGDAETILAYYLECARPGHLNYVEPTKNRAELILDGLYPIEQNVEKVIAIMDNQD